MDFTSTIFVKISELITAHVADNFQVLYSFILPIWSIGVVIYYVVVAWEIIYSNKEMVINEFVKHFMVLALITACLGASGYYLDVIVPFVMDSGEIISSAMIGNTGLSSLDNLLDAFFNQLGKEWENLPSGFLSPGSTIMFCIKAVFLIISCGVFVLYAMIYMLIAKVMTGILLSLGAAFVMFAAIPSTRQMFTAWVGSCLNYIFLNIAYGILFSLLINFVSDLFVKNGADMIGNMNTLLLMVLIFMTGVFLLAQIGVLVSTLTGGVGINGLTSAVGSAIRQGAGIGKGALKGASKVAGTASKLSSSAIKNFLGNGIKGG